MPRVTFVLLVIQASNMLLASVVQIFVLPAAFVISLIGVGGLVALAVGALRDWRWARRATYVVESLMLLGTLPRLLQSLEARVWPDSAWLLGSIGLPVAVLMSLRMRQHGASALPAVLLGISGLVHLGQADQHPQLAGLFVLDAILLFACAALVGRGGRWRSVSKWLLVANLFAYVLFVLPGREGVDAVGIQTKLLELIALGLIVAPLEGAGRWVKATAGFAACIMLTGAGTWVGVARAGGVGLHVHLPDEVVPPTAAERLAAGDLAQATRDGIARYANPSAALAAGYEPSGPPSLPTIHYMNKAFEKDADVLEPSRPEGLVYANSSSGPRLVGAVYKMPRLGVAGPAPGGSITHWHDHDNVCIVLPVIALSGLATPIGTCPPLSINVATPDMLHVWTVDNPGGPFADELDKSVLARLAD